MVKSCGKCKQTRFGTGHGLEQVNGLNGAADGRRNNIQLNDQTGELTISNIQSDQTGVYKLEFDTSGMILHRKFRIDIIDAVKTVSVMEGESTTVPTGVIEIQGYDLILWKFKDNSVAEINKGTNQFLVYDSGDVRFKGRLKLNEKSGSLIISNSKTTDSGDYHLNMSSSSHTLQRTISVTVSEFQFMSVKDGDSVTLQTNTKTQSEDLILWTFGPSTCIAQINRTITLYENALNGKFRDRLKLDHQTGSLTITNTRTTDSGLYQLEISSSSSKEPIYKRFNVAVSGSGVSPGAVAGIVIVVVILVAAVVAAVAIYYRNKISKLESRRGN